VAQNPQAKKTLQIIDSLKNTLPKNYITNAQSLKDTIIAKKYYLIGENYLSIQADSTLLYAEKCLKIFENVHNSNTKITIYNLFGRAYGRKNKQDDRLKYLNKALKLAEKLQDKRQMAIQLTDIANTYFAKDNGKVAIQFYLKALPIAEKENDLLTIAKACNELGICYKNLGNYPKSVQYSMQAIKFYEAMGAPELRNVAMVSGNMGIVLRRQGIYEQAIKYTQKCIDIYEGLGNKMAVAQNKVNLASIYKLNNKEKEALQIYEETLPIFEEGKNMFYIGMV
jgi:tetratricopeptide (TPR) repeat protein